MSDETGFVSIAEAADAMGISERQARRYAGRLDADNRREAGLGAGHQAGRASGLTVNLEAMQQARALATGESADLSTKPDGKPDASAQKDAASTCGPDVGPDTTPDMGPDARTPDAGRGPDMGPDAVLIDELRDQVKFLRTAIEQHQRSEAELRAALRTALAAMPKALTEGAAKPVVFDGKSEVQVLTEDVKAAPEPAQFRGQNDGVAKVTPDAQSTRISATVARQRGFRGWLLEKLRG